MSKSLLEKFECVNKDEMKECIRSQMTARVMAEYAAQHKGEKITRTREGWRVGKRGAGAGLVIYADKNTFHDFSEDTGGDCFDLIAHCERLDIARDFPTILQRAAEFVGSPAPAPAPAPGPAPARRGDKAGYDAMCRLWGDLRNGLESESCRSWMQKRGFSLDLTKLENIGFADREFKAKRYTIPANSLVVRDENAFKRISFDPGTGKRLDDGVTQIGGQTYWIPRQSEEHETIFVTEGETSAIALLCAGYNARPLKPQAGKLEELASNHPIVLAYDNDKQGRQYTDKALRAVPDARSISDLFPDGGDPNDFLLEMGEHRLRRLIDSEMRREITPPEKKSQKVAAREFAEGFYSGWRADEFTGRVYDRDGQQKTIDDAIAECWRANKRLKECNAKEVLINDVVNNPARRFNSLTENVRALARDYRESGAIDGLCRSMGLDAYESRRMRLWLYQVCARAMMPGEKTDCMLILVSRREGMKKTSFFNGISKTISGIEAAEYDPEKAKDLTLALSQNSVIVINEVDRVFKCADVATVKNIITQTSSNVRAPYDRAPKYRLNTAVFAGTTNEANPIPAGEGDARRYWVIRPRNFAEISTPQFRAIMAEAAHDLVESLRGVVLDAQLAKNKIWVETDEERDETVHRNRSFKAPDNASIAISVGARMIKAVAPQFDDSLCYPASAWAAVFATGSLEPVGSPLEFSLPKCEVAKVRRLITARITRAKDRNGQNGYRLKDLVHEFIDLEEADDVTAPAQTTPAPAQTTPAPATSQPKMSFVECDDDNPFRDPDCVSYRIDGNGLERLCRK